MGILPTGTVTFLFTDIEGSTKLWEKYPETMKSALAKHDAILKEAVEANHGQIIKTTGDGVHAVFATAIDAVNASIDAQRTVSRFRSLFKNSEVYDQGPHGNAHWRGGTARWRLLWRHAQPRSAHHGRGLWWANPALGCHGCAGA